VSLLQLERSWHFIFLSMFTFWIPPNISFNVVLNFKELCLNRLRVDRWSSSHLEYLLVFHVVLIDLCQCWSLFLYQLTLCSCLSIVLFFVVLIWQFSLLEERPCIVHVVVLSVVLLFPELINLIVWDLLHPVVVLLEQVFPINELLEWCVLLSLHKFLLTTVINELVSLCL